VEPRPVDLKFALPQQVEMAFTGPEEVLRQDHIQDQVLDRYERDLAAMAGCCLYCRVEGRKFDHPAQKCSRRFHWTRAKSEEYQARKREEKEWIKQYSTCWKCYQPQDICRVADPEAEETECRFPDMVMPLCYGAFCRPGRNQWLQKHFQQSFPSQLDYMLWLGETASLGENQCIQANCVAALILSELR
jgi:hypothetical protein